MNEEQGLKNVIDYIEAHIRESLSAEEIASACYYSRSNTKALFKKVFQYGMMEYAARRKLTQAAGELLSTSQSVCEIALEYGFASQEVFTRAFKKMWQETPARFRKRRRFWQLFPRQDFFCDDCDVFRRRFCLEDMRKMLEHREHTWIVCFDMEAPGIRYLKTVFGGEGGERFVLDCLQRIEGEMREGDHCSVLQAISLCFWHHQRRMRRFWIRQSGYSEEMGKKCIIRGMQWSWLCLADL